MSLTSSKKYILICEGAFTEPQYFKRLIENRNVLKLDCLVDLLDIPRYEMDRNETNIETMITIATDYVNYCRDGVISRRFYVTWVFEKMVEKYDVAFKNSGLAGKNC